MRSALRVAYSAKNVVSTQSRMMSANVSSLDKKSASLIRTEEATAATNYHPLPMVFSRAEGVFAWDPEGKKYFDFLSAYSAVNQGHQHPRIVKAMIDQLSGVALSSRAFYNDKFPDFAEFVTKYFGFDKVLPMNTGAEAVETGIKIARKYAYEVRGVPDGQAVILSACGCFHGRTMNAISMSCDPEATLHFGPLVPGHDKVRYNDLEHLEKKLKQHNGNVAAYIVEPIQGEAGVFVPDEGYLTKAKALCEKYDCLFIADEVQTGIARTGKLLACDHEGVKPDILLLGKAVSGGLYPVSLVLANDKIMSVITPGTHGSTFGGNPLACVVAEEALRVVEDEKLAERAEKLGQIFRTKMQRLVEEDTIVELVRGKGLLNAFVIKTEGMDKSAWDLCLLMKSRGLLAKPTHGNIIRLAPPLVITEEHLDECMQIIESSVRDIVTMDRKDIPGADPEFKPHVEHECARCNAD